MATVREVIIPKEKKKDGTWNVKIRVNHNGKTLYIKTHHFVGQKQIRSDHTIKDPIILKAVNPVLDDYRTKISELGPKLELYDVERLIDYLVNDGAISAEQINVIEFAFNRIAELKEKNRLASAADMTKVINSLVDFFGSKIIPVTEIRSKMLYDYEKYLRHEREIERPDHLAIPIREQFRD
jgi:hypothetical protein